MNLLKKNLRYFLRLGSLALPLLFAGALFSQDSAGGILSGQDLYESRLYQLDFQLARQSPPDSLAIIFREEAAYFAGQQDWETALELLNQGLELLAPVQEFPEKHIPVTEPEVLIPPNNWQWTVEAGSDYSRQEYELSLVESDSVVLEQLNSPYFSLQLSRLGSWRNENYQIYSAFRGDGEFLQSSISLALETPSFHKFRRLEYQSNVFWEHQNKAGSFWENMLRLNLNRPLANTMRLAFDSEIRFKKHITQDSVYGDILSGELRAAFRKYLNLMSWIEISSRPSYYREDQNPGLSYSQLQNRLEIQHRQNYNRRFSARLDHYFRRFVSREPDNEVENGFHRFIPRLEGEIPWISFLGFESAAEWEHRSYRQPDISYSDFNFLALNAAIKFYFGDYNSAGLGLVYETETHSAAEPENETIIEQENYNARGFLLSLDFLQAGGFFVSLSYQLTFRNYPNGGTADPFGFYSNRKIHSIQAIGYLPLSKHWQCQLFVNYDDDRDRDREANDSVNTIFNWGISYRF